MTKAKSTTPNRMCMICRQLKPKDQLIRLVAVDNAIVIAQPKSGGRGTYICQNPQCIARLAKYKNIKKKLGCALADNLIEQLEEQIAE